MQLQPEIIIIRLAQQGFLTKAVQEVDFGDKVDGALIKAAQEVDNNNEEEELCTSSNYDRKKGRRSHDLVTQNHQQWVSSPAWLQSVLGSFDYASGRSGTKITEGRSVRINYRSPW